MTAGGCRIAALLALCTLGGAGRLVAQQEAPPTAIRASGAIPGDHWAVEAIWRLEELGLVRGLLPAQRSVPISVVGAALAEAVEAAERSDPDRLPLVEGWRERFTAEFPGAATAAPGPGITLDEGAAAVGYLGWTGRDAPGRAEFPPDRTGADPLPDRTGPTGAARGAAALGDRVGVQLAARAGPDDARVDAAELSLRLGAWSLAAGRQRVGYGWAERGGVVLSGVEPVDRVELATLRPVRAPGIFGRVGPLAIHSFFGPLDGARHPGRPWFWGGRVAIQPHPRLSVSVNRAAMFGGDSARVETTPGAILRMLAGGLGGGAFENQIVSLAARLRLPTESVVPLTAYAEWGAEDAAGAWFDVPGRVVGVRAPAMPGAEAWSLAVEYASLAESCCGNPEWYRHYGFPGAWSGPEGPYGHALGGNGSEISLHSTVLPRNGRLKLEGTAFARDRGPENLYVPGRAGRSWGASGEVEIRPTERSELFVHLAREGGDGWSESMIEAGGRWFLGTRP